MPFRFYGVTDSSSAQNQSETQRKRRASEYEDEDALFLNQRKQTQKADTAQDLIRPLSTLAATSEVRGDTERGTAAYTSVHEHSSTVSAKQFADAIESRKKFIVPADSSLSNELDIDNLPDIESFMKQLSEDTTWEQVDIRRCPSIETKTISSLTASPTDTQAKKAQVSLVKNKSKKKTTLENTPEKVSFCFEGKSVDEIHALSTSHTLNDLSIILDNMPLTTLFSHFGRYGLTYTQFTRLSSAALKDHFAKYAVDTSQPLPHHPPKQKKFSQMPFSQWHRSITSSTNNKIANCARHLGYPYASYLKLQLKDLAPSESLAKNTKATFAYFKNLSSHTLERAMGKDYHAPLNTLIQNHYFSIPDNQKKLQDCEHVSSTENHASPLDTTSFGKTSIHAAPHSASRHVFQPTVGLNQYSIFSGSSKAVQAPAAFKTTSNLPQGW